ncbi:hypothetical protein BKA62DRAFT_716269, partial [Auriculariales sp. MPI-PUGE-AT-0066]
MGLFSRLDACLGAAVVWLLYLAASPAPMHEHFPLNIFADLTLKCSPEDFSSGYWEPKPGQQANATSVEEIIAASGWTGCASMREPLWHLAASDERMIQWRGSASHYTYVPPPTCQGFQPPCGDEFVRLLVERGGWLLLGDSVSEGQYFSLSCELHPHVRAEPDWSADPSDRSIPQHLFLDKFSPLVPHLKFPPGFDLDRTPLVTFRRTDVIMDPDELVEVFAKAYPERASKPTPQIKDIFGTSQEVFYHFPASEQLEMFTSPPPLNYGLLVANSAAHWTQSVFEALDGPDAIIDFFAHATRSYITRITRAFDGGQARPKWTSAPRYSSRTSSGHARRVVFRSATTGTDDCLSSDWRELGPSREVPPMNANHWNWRWIWRLNEEVANAVAATNHPMIHYLPIDRPALLRGDAHVLFDCVHFAAGTGAMETWTDYIANFVYRERL